MVLAIKGVTVVLEEHVKTGEDDFGAPILKDNTVEVPNVLIEPASNDDVVSENEVNGKHIAYVLHIPKGDNHNWKDAVVHLPIPWNCTVKTYGDCLIYDPELTPGEWNKKVKVESYE